MAEGPSRAIMLFGTEEKVEPRKRLRAGPLTCELDRGNLRYIKIGAKEAIRAIAFIVRDQDWGTYNPAIENLKIGQGPNDFEVSYEAICKDAGQELRYGARIKGAADGTLALRGDRDGRSAISSPTGRASSSCIRSRASPASRSRCCTPMAGPSARPSRSWSTRCARSRTSGR